MMENRRAVLYLVLVFALGATAGVLGTLWAARTGLADTGWTSGKWAKEHPVEWLTRELELTSEQQKQLEVILDETGNAYEAIRERVRPEYDQVRQAGRAKIRALLTEAQRAKFEELVQRIDEDRARRRREREQRKAGEAPSKESGGQR